MAASSITANAFTSLGATSFIHTTVRSAKGAFTSTTGIGGAKTITASDRIWMLQIPSNSVVLDGYLKGHIDNDGTTFKVGCFGATGTMSSTLGVAMTLSNSCTVFRFKPAIAGNDGPPLTLSASDDIAASNIGIEVTTAGTDTNTVSIVLVVFYAPRGFV